MTQLLFLVLLITVHGSFSHEEFDDEDAYVETLGDSKNVMPQQIWPWKISSDSETVADDAKSAMPMQPWPWEQSEFASAASNGEDKTEKLEKELKEVKENLQMITRQLMLQQFGKEEQTRSDGYSGVKQIRTGKGGSKSYFSNNQAGRSFLAMHDHANNIRTVGLGEFIAVLNGVQFRTRHNDYRLKMPNDTSSELHATQDIPFPDVPPEVLNKANVSEQIIEMRKWFQAWKDSDHSVRDYRKYFKPVLCYLEGAWMNQQGDSIDEPFESDRHQLDALGWFDLQEKVRFTAYSGSKSLLENLAYLPTTIMRINNGTPVFAQWNYRIMCHPVNKSIPLYMFKADDELSARMKNKRTFGEYVRSRNAHFHLNEKWSKDWSEQARSHVVLDELMEEIPGKDNYQGKLIDGGYDAAVSNLDGSPKDVSRYHRWFRMSKKDAMGDSVNHRGYSDQYMFAAQTTQPRVADMRFNYCSKIKRKKVCVQKNDKWTYAIPLEIIYLTPLNKWNPYGIRYEAEARSQEDPSRNGKCTVDKAYKHTMSRMFAQTPKEFYRDVDDKNKDNADTSANGCFLGADGQPHAVSSTGTRIILPVIEGIGSIRTRWPIAPIHRSGDPVFKNYEALKDILMNPETYKFMEFTDRFMGNGSKSEESGGTTDPNKEIKFRMSRSQSKHTTEHVHHFMVLQKEVDLLKQEGNNYYINVDTEQANGHSHRLKIRYDTQRKKFRYLECGSRPEGNNGRQWKCWDKHGYFLTIEE